MLFRLSRDWAIYTGISFLSCLATILPVTRVGIFFLILTYGVFGVAEVFKTFAKIEDKGNASGKKAVVWAFSESAAEFIFLAIAIVVGIYLGVHH